ncbi:Equistatin [Exaiptasia diaphana]|nr:Equistatin [Exaiptasia diaphana]
MQGNAQPGRVGAFIPQCKENGEFEEKQCWGSTGYCWCVDKDGQEILGTKIRGDPDCSNSRVRKALTLCQYQQTIVINIPGSCGPPSCNDDGSFADVQCCASTGYCHCVDKNGKEIVGTKQRGRPSC